MPVEPCTVVAMVVGVAADAVNAAADTVVVEYADLQRADCIAVPVAAEGVEDNLVAVAVVVAVAAEDTPVAGNTDVEP